jgi:catechol 2,3-dioxygenase-like lactoylglutathione lyase family enzyme
MTLKGIHHFALVVPDVETSSQWYQDTLGFTVERRFEVADFATKFIHLIHASGIRLELMSRMGSQPSPDVGTDAFSSLLTQGAKHIGILVENIEELEQELQAKGVEIVHPVTVVDLAGVKNFWIRDNAGNLIEFNQWLS